MSKERLEEIEERVLVDKVYYKYLDGTKGHWGKVYTLSEGDYKYLKEQAERVQELENHLKLYDFWYRTAYEQNKRYREALEFYASGNHYLVYYDKIILLDDGEIARKALEGKMI